MSRHRREIGISVVIAATLLLVVRHMDYGVTVSVPPEVFKDHYLGVVFKISELRDLPRGRENFFIKRFKNFILKSDNKLVLRENGVIIPPHDIDRPDVLGHLVSAQRGLHFRVNHSLYFSSTDKTNPATNGRRYEITAFLPLYYSHLFFLAVAGILLAFPLRDIGRIGNRLFETAIARKTVMLSLLVVSYGLFFYNATYGGLAVPVHLSSLVCVVISLALMFFAFMVLRHSPFGLVLLGILVVSRLFIMHTFELLNSAPSVGASLAGALKDLALILPVLFLPRNLWGKLLVIGLSILLLFLNAADTLFVTEALTRVRSLIFQHINIQGILARPDYAVTLALAIAVGAAITIFAFNLLYRPLRKTRLNVLFTAFCWLLLLLNIYHSFDYGVRIGAIEVDRRKLREMTSRSAAANMLAEMRNTMPEASAFYEPSTEAERAFLREAGLLDAKQRGDRALSRYRRVVIVFIESLMNAMLDVKDGSVMPNLSAYRERYFSAENHYPGMTDSCGGVYSAFASRPTYYWDIQNRPRVDTIASLARQQGFSTAFFVTASKYFNNMNLYYPKQMKVAEIIGDEEIGGIDIGKIFHEGKWGEKFDAKTYAMIIRWMLERKNDKILIGVRTLQTHAPFTPDKNRPTSIAAFEEDMRITDREFADFLASLDENGLFDSETLVIVTGDHNINHGGKEIAEFLGLKDFLGNHPLPLIFISKDLAPFEGLDRNMLCCHHDLAPTLGDLLGFPELDSYYGKSLFADGKRYIMIWGSRIKLEDGSSDIEFKSGETGVPVTAVLKWYSEILNGLPVSAP